MKKRFMILALVVLMMLVLAACGGNSGQADTPADEAPADQTANIGEPAGQADDLESEEPLPEGNFSYTEVQYVFDLTEEDIVALYGDPLTKKKYDLFATEDAAELSYNGSVFQIAYLEQEPYNYLFAATVDNDKIPAPRDVKIGDSMDSVLAKFPAGTDETMFQSDTDPNRTYRLLYGEDVYMQDCGRLEYEGDVPVAIVYTSEGINLTYELQDGKVAKVSYAAPVT